VNKDLNITALFDVIKWQNGGNLLKYTATSINAYHTTRRHNPKDGKLGCNRREKIKYRILPVSSCFFFGDNTRSFVRVQNNRQNYNAVYLLSLSLTHSHTRTHIHTTTHHTHTHTHTILYSISNYFCIWNYCTLELESSIRNASHASSLYKKMC